MKEGKTDQDKENNPMQAIKTEQNNILEKNPEEKRNANNMSESAKHLFMNS